jgi:hypothetical protein
MMVAQNEKLKSQGKNREVPIPKMKGISSLTNGTLCQKDLYIQWNNTLCSPIEKEFEHEQGKNGNERQIMRNELE